MHSNLVLQAARDGVEPSIVKVFVEGHKGPDPNRPELLCDDHATDKLVSTRLERVSILISSLT